MSGSSSSTGGFNGAPTGRGELEPLALAEIEREISRLSRELSTQTVEHREAALAYARADHVYDVAMAKAVMAQPRVVEGSKVTVDERQARAVIAVETQDFERRRSEAMLKAAQEKGKNLREQIGALRTLAANAREVTTHGY